MNESIHSAAEYIELAERAISGVDQFDTAEGSLSGLSAMIKANTFATLALVRTVQVLSGDLVALSPARVEFAIKELAAGLDQRR